MSERDIDFPCHFCDKPITPEQEMVMRWNYDPANQYKRLAIYSHASHTVKVPAALAAEASSEADEGDA